jgi:hypothetical protein
MRAPGGDGMFWRILADGGQDMGVFWLAGAPAVGEEVRLLEGDPRQGRDALLVGQAVFRVRAVSRLAARMGIGSDVDPLLAGRASFGVLHVDRDSQGAVTEALGATPYAVPGGGNWLARLGAALDQAGKGDTVLVPGGPMQAFAHAALKALGRPWDACPRIEVWGVRDDMLDRPAPGHIDYRQGLRVALAGRWATDYQAGGLKAREKYRQGSRGVILASHGSHGHCYDIQFDEPPGRATFDHEEVTPEELYDERRP